MHELSLACEIIETVERALQLQQVSNAHVQRVYLRIGALAGIDPDALSFGFEVAANQSAIAGAMLEIEHVPIVVYCPTCAQCVALPSIQEFRCPRCQTLTGDVRQGRELEIVSIQLEGEA